MTSPYPIDVTTTSSETSETGPSDCSVWLYCPICCALYAGGSEDVPCPNTDQPDHHPATVPAPLADRKD